MITKTIEIDGRQVTFKASAAVPRLYRFKFRRDILQDLKKLQKAAEKTKKGEEFEAIDLELFENVAYIMAQHADPENVPNTAEEWLVEFDVFSIYEILPEILELWGLNLETQVESKKKLARVVGK